VKGSFPVILSKAKDLMLIAGGTSLEAGDEVLRCAHDDSTGTLAHASISRMQCLRARRSGIPMSAKCCQLDTVRSIRE
jgi:hypothetical protein